MKNALLIILLCCVFGFKSHGTHIVGGEISYECIGNNEYNISLIVYRDCLLGLAPFDEPAYLTIRTNTGVFLRINMPLVDTTFIPSDINDPCFEVPSGLCVARGLYLSVVTLPPVAGGYTLSYQRCCRNNTIKNITNPRDYGTTITTQIPDPTLAGCNSAPKFSNRPPLAICLGSDFKFNHEAVDPDGDSLVYEFCDPLHGGSSGFGGGPFGGPRPDTAAPPPYKPIIWNPGYSAIDPIVGNPKFKIDPVTGEITGSPILMGNYVFAVCVKEFRNGVQIGMTRREYQVNVVRCQSNTKANFQIPPVCEGLTVNFNNLSRTSRTFLWDFGVAGINSDSSLLKDPTFTFPDTGSYVVKLCANRQYDCADTIEQTIRVFPKITANILPVEWRCTSKPIFDFQVEGDFQPYTNLLWTFDQSETSSSNQKEVLGVKFPNKEGYYPVTFTASHGPCSVSSSIEAIVAPPPAIKYAIRANDGCAPLKLQLEDYSTAWSKIYRLWYIDELVLTDSLVQRIYDKPGTYKIGLSVYTKSGCKDTVPPEFKIFNVNPSPSAGFSISTTKSSIFNPDVEMTDRSIGADECVAYFGNDLVTRNCNYLHTFTKPGIYRVSQLVTNEYGCTDTASKMVEITDEYAFFIPNSFTPNNDGKNEIFKPNVVGAKQYDFRVLDRWGKLVFQTDDIKQGWDGLQITSGEPAPIGMYIYRAEVRSYIDEIKLYQGEFQLIR